MAHLVCDAKLGAESCPLDSSGTESCLYDVYFLIFSNGDKNEAYHERSARRRRYYPCRVRARQEQLALAIEAYRHTGTGSARGGIVFPGRAAWKIGGSIQMYFDAVVVSILVVGHWCMEFHQNSFA